MTEGHRQIILGRGMPGREEQVDKSFSKKFGNEFLAAPPPVQIQFPHLLQASRKYFWAGNLKEIERWCLGRNIPEFNMYTAQFSFRGLFVLSFPTWHYCEARWGPSLLLPSFPWGWGSSPTPPLGLSRTSLTISAGIISTCCTLCLWETLRTRPSETTCFRFLSGKRENLPPGLLNPGREYLHPSSSPRMILICLSLPFFQHHSGYPQAAFSLSRSRKCFLLQILSDIIHTYHNVLLPNKNCV